MHKNPACKNWMRDIERSQYACLKQPFLPKLVVLPTPRPSRLRILRSGQHPRHIYVKNASFKSPILSVGFQFHVTFMKNILMPITSFRRKSKCIKIDRNQGTGLLCKEASLIRSLTCYFIVQCHACRLDFRSGHRLLPKW